jgi:hypothetical protein
MSTDGGTLGPMARADHIARAYAVPLSEFTATRNRVIDELRRSGRADEARALARIRKPSVPLWAVNRLATTEGGSLAALFDAVARVRKTQLRDPRAAADALRAQRIALDVLVTRGKQILTDAGLAASQQTLRRLSDTLMGAAVDQEHARSLRRGELTEELHAPGFEAFSGARVPAQPRLRLVRSAAASPSAPRADRETSAARAARQQQRSDEAEQLTREAEELARQVSALEAESTNARVRLADVDRRLQAARHAARRTAAAAKRARGKSARA